MLVLSINIVEAVSNLIIAAIEQLGYVGVFIAMGIESACVPLPSEMIMPFAGYVAWEGKLALIGVAIAGTFGCLAGSLVIYFIGAYGGRPLLDRYGRDTHT
jgi:membrane protein DedA with SNARE-associated domain